MRYLRGEQAAICTTDLFAYVGKQFHLPLAMGVATVVIEAEAQAQTLCMATHDLHRAYHAFAAKQVPRFEEN